MISPKPAPFFLPLCTLPALFVLTAGAPPDADTEGTVAEMATAARSEDWRSQRPEVSAPRPPVLPVFQKTVLSNGMTLLVAEQPSLPLVSFRVVFKGGSSQDPDAQAGLTQMTFAMLEQGAGKLDALAFSDRVADLGASFGGGAGRDQGEIGISGLRRNDEAMLALLADAVMRPRMAPDDFDRLQQEMLANIARRRGSPQGLAMEHFPRLIYGPKHPYGHPADGTMASVQKLTLDAVKAHYARLFAPRHAALIAVGDITLARTQALAEAAFGTWSTPGEDLKAIAALEPKRRKRIVVIDKPGAPQTFAIVGRPLFGRGHPDEVTVRLANSVFGGTFSSRLNMNLREDKGYTYGARASVSYRRGTGVLLAYTALREDVTGKGLKEVFKELDGLRKQPLTAAEVDDAKSGRVRSLTGQFQGIGASSGAASALFIYDLPLDYFAQLPKRYEEATLTGIRTAATTYFKAPLMTVLLVGDAKKIKPQLRRARLGRVEVLTPGELGP